MILAGLDVVVLPFRLGIAVFNQGEPNRRGCPAKAKANARLISKSITVKGQSVLLVKGHMRRLANGRADLHLFVRSCEARDY